MLLLLSAIVSAQDELPESDFIAYFNEQLYTLDAENDALIAYDACMPDEEILGQFNPSPDGSKFLISTFPNIITEAREAFGSLGDIPYGVNYWLCDTASDSLDRIYAQPGADDSFEDELPATDDIQSNPVWSPDGTQLAWTQLNFIEGVQSVVTLDIESGETSEFIVDVPLAPFPGPAEVIGWTEQGLLLWVFVFDEVDFFNIESLYIIDMETENIARSYEVINGGETADFYNQRELVRTISGLQYAIEFQEAGWVLVDIATGEITPTTGRLARFSPNNPEGISLQYEIDFEYNYNWQIVTNENAEPVILRAYPPQRVAISPDGTQVAYADSVLHIYSAGGEVVDIANSDGFADDFQARVLWGTWQLTFIELTETELAPPTSCDGAPQIRLITGISARVIAETVPNRIRSQPTTTAPIVGEIAGGDSFEVRGGPVCAEGYTWFQIQYNGTTGWTAEGTGNTYFVRPDTP